MTNPKSSTQILPQTTRIFTEEYSLIRVNLSNLWLPRWVINDITVETVIGWFATFAAMIEYQVKNRETGPTVFNMALHALRIVFMGTPEFAVASLDGLVKAGYNIVGSYSTR